jgi:NADH-quinone oxidoreductase subunit J
MIVAATAIDLGVFMVASAVCVVGAVGVIIARNPIHSALMLVATLFGIAVHFVALGAEFVAAVQVMVYAGAIVVLFLFVIMLLGVDRSEKAWERDPLRSQRIIAIAFGAFIFVQIVALGGRSWAGDGVVEPCLPTALDINGQPIDSAGDLIPEDQLCTLSVATIDPRTGQEVQGSFGISNPRSTEGVSPFDNIQQVAKDVFINELLAFEAVSVLLIVAVVAAVVLAKRSPATEELIDLEDRERLSDDPEVASNDN